MGAYRHHLVFRQAELVQDHEGLGQAKKDAPAAVLSQLE